MIPYRGTDITSCGPVPAGYYGENADSGNHMPEPPPAIWKKTWGAIAFSSASGVVGVATGMKNKKAASQAALADCRSLGGGNNCKVGMEYFNQCAAIAWGAGQSNTSTAETVEIASDNALKRCEQQTKDCRIVYSDCSKPVRVR
jgi:hypothetical protein